MPPRRRAAAAAPVHPAAHRGGLWPAGRSSGLAAAFKLLDLGFVAALNRPFDPLIDWRYAGSLVGLARDALGAVGTVSSWSPARAVLALLVLVPLAVLRLARVAARHRPRAAGLVAGLTAALAGAGPARRARSGRAGRLARHRGVRRGTGHPDPRAAARPPRVRSRRPDRPAARRAGDELFSALRGKDVLVVFVESYGRVALEDPAFSPGVNAVLEAGTAALRGRRLHQPQRLPDLAHVRRDQLARPRHAAVRPVDRQPAALRRAGDQPPADAEPAVRARRVAHRRRRPGQHRDWPQGEFYDFDQRLRLAQRRLRGPPVRLPDDARPVHARRVPPARARPARRDGR